MAGLILFLTGLVILVLTFFPVAKEEIRYSLITKRQILKIVEPVNRDFGIVIPKIGANASVIDKVDPFDSKVYQKALTHGVAHAIGTAYPGKSGNTFIFAHSSTDWYTANRYNSVFYLLNKLESGDKIDIYFEKQKYVYVVTGKKVIEPMEVSYLNHNSPDLQNPEKIIDGSILTLMTCWPPGTDLKRLIIQARLATF